MKLESLENALDYIPTSKIYNLMRTGFGELHISNRIIVKTAYAYGLGPLSVAIGAGFVFHDTLGTAISAALAGGFYAAGLLGHKQQGQIQPKVHSNPL